MSQPVDDRATLAIKLRALREDAGLSTTRLAAELGWSQSKVSKIENRRTKPSVDDVRAWSAATGAPADVAAELMDVAESIQVASIIWDRTLSGGRAAHQRGIGRILADAARIQVSNTRPCPDSFRPLPGVSLAILPTGARPSVVHAHPFVIYTLPDGSQFTTIETYTRELTLTDPEEISVYSRIHDSLLADSVTGEQARRLLSAMRTEAMNSVE